MVKQKNVTGVILAGGLARRMNRQDKGLISYQGQPMIRYAIAAVEPLVGQLLINANRNIEQYQRFGYQVIADQTDTFDGPLAGILTGMKKSTTEILLVMPCDSPLVKAQHLQRLLNAFTGSKTDIAVAFDGQRLHPVILVLKSSLESSLQQYLASGQRKIDLWFQQHDMIPVDFSDQPEIFQNINSLDDLSSLESASHE